jgi:hypothetical protein
MVTPRKKSTRAQRRTRKLKRAQVRIRRRTKQAKRVYRRTKAAPGRVRDFIRASGGPPLRPKAKPRKPNPNKQVKCSCGEKMPAKRWESHKRRHQRQQQRSERKQERSGRPSRVEAAKTAGPWALVGGVLVAPAALIGSGPWVSPWMLAASGACAVASGAAYASERKHGISQMTNGWASRRAERKEARRAGCSGACMHSVKPRENCDCSCRGASHGSLTGRAA